MRAIIVPIALLTLVAAHGATAQPPARATLENTELCVERAQRDTELVPGQIRRLCIATPNPSGPVACYIEATQSLDLTDSQGVELCRCSADAQPAQCVRALRGHELVTDQEMIVRCSPAIALQLRADCTPIP